jgi:DNA-binding MarR family transcriptional regulator
MFERCLYFNINALTRAVNRIWDSAFAEFDLSPSHAYLLRLVLSQPGLTPKQISLELKLEKSTVTRFIDVLGKKGFVQRKQSISGDAREQGIYPTNKSIKIADKLENKGNEVYQKMVSSIGKNSLTSLVQQLRNTEQRIK